MNDEITLKDSLKALALKLENDVDAAFADGKFQQINSLFYRYSIDDFNYDENGINIKRSSGQYIEKGTWSTRGLADIINSARKSKEYNISGNLLAKGFKKQGKITAEGLSRWGNLANFINELAQYFLPDSGFSRDKIDEYVDDFIKKINNEPLKYIIKIELSGIVVLTSEFKFIAPDGTEIELRRVVIEDFQQEFPAHNFFLGNVKPYIKSKFGSFLFPSAILKLECNRWNAVPAKT